MPFVPGVQSAGFAEAHRPGIPVEGTDGELHLGAVSSRFEVVVQYLTLTTTVPVRPFSSIVSLSLLKSRQTFPFTVTLRIGADWG